MKQLLKSATISKEEYDKAVSDVEAAKAGVAAAQASCQATVGFSGLPKLRQSVTAIGRAPTQARLRTASAIACCAPRRGSTDV